MDLRATNKLIPATKLSGPKVYHFMNVKVEPCFTPNTVPNSEPRTPNPSRKNYV